MRMAFGLGGARVTRAHHLGGYWHPLSGRLVEAGVAVARQEYTRGHQGYAG